MGLLSTEYHVLAARKMLEKYKNNKLIVVTDNESIARLVIDRLNDYQGRVFLLSDILGRSEMQIDAIKLWCLHRQSPYQTALSVQCVPSWEAQMRSSILLHGFVLKGCSTFLLF